MSEYGYTNRGAAFQPFPEQQFILQGKLDMYGVELVTSCSYTSPI